MMRFALAGQEKLKLVSWFLLKQSISTFLSMSVLKLVSAETKHLNFLEHVSVDSNRFPLKQVWHYDEICPRGPRKAASCAVNYWPWLLSPLSAPHAPVTAVGFHDVPSGDWWQRQVFLTYTLWLRSAKSRSVLQVEAGGWASIKIFLFAQAFQ